MKKIKAENIESPDLHVQIEMYEAEEEEESAPEAVVDTRTPEEIFATLRSTVDKSGKTQKLQQLLSDALNMSSSEEG